MGKSRYPRFFPDPRIPPDQAGCGALGATALGLKEINPQNSTINLLLPALQGLHDDRPHPHRRHGGEGEADKKDIDRHLHIVPHTIRTSRGGGHVSTGRMGRRANDLWSRNGLCRMVAVSGYRGMDTSREGQRPKAPSSRI